MINSSAPVLVRGETTWRGANAGRRSRRRSPARGPRGTANLSHPGNFCGHGLLGSSKGCNRSFGGRDPAFTLTALATLALGIGVTAAIFSVAYGVLWRPLPYPSADRLVIIRSAQQTAKGHDHGARQYDRDDEQCD
jgi:hypothetical protein